MKFVKNVLLAVVFAAVCSEISASNPEAIPAVKTADVIQSAKYPPRRYVGTVEAVRQVEIMPRVTGELRQIHFQEGSMVKEGEKLFSIEDTTYAAAVAALKAEKEQLLAQADFARKEFERNSELIKNKAVSVSAYDKALFDHLTAQALLKKVEAALIDAENNLSYTQIKAAVTGKIGKSNFSVGDLVTPGGGKMTDIEMISPIYVRFSISETVLRREFGTVENLQKYGIARIKLADNSSYPETAKIVLTNNKINPTTNTISVWASYKNSDANLIPGGFVSVFLENSAVKKFPAVIPSAIQFDGKNFTVFTVNENLTVTRKIVTPGVVSGNFQLIESGLNGNEKVVVEGIHKLQDGMKIRIVE